MTPEEEQQIIREATKVYGPTLQLVVATEELSELSQEICKFIRTIETADECGSIDGYAAAERVVGIVDELADATIAIATVKMIAQDLFDDVDIEYRVLKKMEQKLIRLKERIEVC